MGRLDPLLSSDSPDWCTPPEVLEAVRRFRPIRFDPFSNAGSMVDAAESICPPANSLVIPWPLDGLFFANPPYGRELAGCAEKIAKEAALGAEGITLVPARIDTRWFESLAAVRWCAWRRRITFLELESEWRARLESAWVKEGQLLPLGPVEPKRRYGDLVANDPAPFPVALCYHGPCPAAFTAHFESYGTVFAPATAPRRAGRRRGVKGRRPEPRVSVERVRTLLARGFSVREMAEACQVPKGRIELALRTLRAQEAQLGAVDLSKNVHVLHVLGQSEPPFPGLNLTGAPA